MYSTFNVDKINKIKKIKMGKKSDALKRQECEEFKDDRCFSIVLEDRERSFYVEKKEDFENWV